MFWINLGQKCFDLVKSLNLIYFIFFIFEWFKTTHRESGESLSCYVKLRTNASALLFRCSIFNHCRTGRCRCRWFCWHFTSDKFLLLVTMSSTSSDSDMTFDSEQSDIYYVAEVDFKTMKTKLIYLLVFC